MAETNSVFISYTHDSDEHKGFVLKYSDSLNDPGGLDCWIDQYVEDAGVERGWPHWMRTKTSNAKYVLVVCTKKYLDRFNGEPSEAGKGKGSKFESYLMLNEIYQNGSLNPKFIPVVVTAEDVKYIPDILQSHTYYNLADEESKRLLYRKLTNQPRNVKPKVSEIMVFETKREDSNISSDDEKDSSSDIPARIPEIPQYKEMKPGTKILQAFFALPITRRFTIADELKLIQPGESIDSPNLDRLCAKFLERAFERKLLSEVWAKLFDESIDPNPFKNKSK